MYEILGYQKMMFTNKDTGELIEGYNFHLRSDFQLTTENSEGFAVLTKFFASNKIKGIVKVGAFLEFNFAVNNKGEPRITGCSIIS